MVVIQAKPVVGTLQAKSVEETSSDPWVLFCAAVDGGGVVAEASATGGVATIIARHLRYVSCCFCLPLSFSRSLHVGRLLFLLIKWRLGHWWTSRPRSCVLKRNDWRTKLSVFVNPKPSGEGQRS